MNDESLPEGFHIDESQTPQPSDNSSLPEGFQLLEDRYGTVPEQLKTVAEHAASSATFGLSTKAETALGVKPEDIRGRTEENPVSGIAGDIAGLLAPGAPEAKVLGKAGEFVSSAVRGSSTLSKIGKAAVKGAIENALFQGGDEVSKKFSEDPNQSAHTVLADIGLASLFGGGVGGALGAVHPLWDGSKANKFVDEFKSRLNEHLTNPDLETQPSDALSGYHADTNKGSEALYRGAYDESGSRIPGVKDQAVDNLVPELNDDIKARGVDDVAKKLSDKIADMKADPDTYLPKFTKSLESDFNKWQEITQNPNASSADIFKATEDLKRTLQARSKIGIPIDNSNPSYDSINTFKKLASDLRKNLEDESIWGEAGKFQKNVNKAFSEFQQPLKDFNRSFATKIDNEYKVDPDKVNTYLKQAANDKGVIKSEKLNNYLDAADKYRDAINESHEKIGIAGPFEDRSADSVNPVLEKLTPGARAADNLVKNMVNHSAGEVAGAAGGVLGGWPGYMVGKHVVGPVLDSVMPSLIKPILGSATDGTGLKAAIDYMSAYSRGETKLAKGVSNIFKAGKESLPSRMIPTDRDRSKLDSTLKELQTNSEPLSEVGGNVSTYLPDHGQALAQTAANAVNYINNQRPEPIKVSPLDTPIKPDPMAKAKFDRVLNIAQEPLSILNHIKEGTIQPKDVEALNVLYPGLYQKISSALVTQISKLSNSDNIIPYRTKMGMSLFLGQAMDSTMLPQSIVSAQIQQPQQPQQQVRQKKPTAVSAKSMNVVTQSAMTPNQARSAEKSMSKT